MITIFETIRTKSRSALVFCTLLLSTWASGQLPNVDLLANINPGANSGSPNNLFKFGSIVLFAANNGTNGTELWKSDGTAGGTVMVKDINPSGNSSPANFVTLGSYAYFTANDGTNGGALWRTDGTTAGTTLVKDVNTTSTTSQSFIFEMTAIGSKLYFRGNDGTNGEEPWISDGTPAGTVVLKHIRPGSGHSSNAGQYLENTGCFGTYEFVEFNGLVYFNANDGSNLGGQNSELWRTDGTTNGTVLFKDNYSLGGGGPGNLVNAGTFLFFTSDSQSLTGLEPWKTDGTVAGTVMIIDLFTLAANQGSFLGDVPTPYMNGFVYFVAIDKYDPTPPQGSLFYFNNELWRTDGTAANTTKVKEINPSIVNPTADANPNNFFVFNNRLYFSATDGTNGTEPWVTDGTSANTFMLKNIDANANGSSNPFGFTPLNGFLYFRADDNSTNGAELWRTDGTTNGTVLVKDINPGASNGSPSNLEPLNATQMLLSANDGTNGTELFLLGGTGGGGGCTPPTVNMPTVTQPQCIPSVGTIVVNATGSGALEYSVNGGANWQTSNTFNNLSQGNYTIQVRLQATPTCTATYSGNPVVINPPLPPPNGGTISGGGVQICVGGTTPLTISGNSVPGTWYILNGGATVNTSGVVTGVSAGRATIGYSVSDAGCSGSAFAVVYVDPVPNAGTISGTSTICAGSTTNLSSNGDGGGTWSSSNTGVATVNSSGVVSGLSMGTTTISYTVTNVGCGPRTSTMLVTVNAIPNAGTISGTTTVCFGSNTQLSSNGAAGGTWSSTTPSVASVNASGLVTGLSAGSTTIQYTVTAGGCTSSATAVVTVNKQPGLTDCPLIITTANTLQGTCSGIANYNVSASGTPAPTYSFSTTGATSISGSGTGSGSTFNKGQTSVLVTAQNTCGSAVCGFFVVIADNEPPTVTCPSPTATINTDAGASCAITIPNYVSQITPTDNCTGTINETQDIAAGSYSSGVTHNGTVTVHYYATDAANNTTTCTVTITVVDNDAPSVTCPSPTATINTDAGASCSITIPNYVSLLTPTDNCSGIANESQDVPAGSYTSGVSHGATITVHYTATDGANNPTTCTVVITVNDDDKPTVSCPGNVNVSVTNSTACTGTVTNINYTGVSDNCSIPTVSYQLSGATTASGSGNASGLTVNSGVTTVTYLATDVAGLTSACSFTVTVPPCVNGRIIWEINRTSGVKDVTITVSGDQSASVLTPLSGDYTIALGGGANFTITPSKTLNKLNGVNSSDVFRIQQHLSGNPITNPYQLVPADVNSDNMVSALDASIIQQGILGNPSALAQMTKSWRFVPTSHTLTNPPWGFPEAIVLNGVSGNQSNLNFYGMKVGDVAATYANPANSGAGNPLILRILDTRLEAGQTIAVAVEADALSDLAALQFALRFDPQYLQLTKAEALSGFPANAHNIGAYASEAGSLRFVWAAEKVLNLKQRTGLFRLYFRALESGATLSSVLSLDDETLPGLVSNSQLAESDVQLRFDASTAVGNPTQAGVQLLQNRPNPFAGATRIAFVLPDACEARLRVVDAAGKVVSEINRQYPAGRQEEVFDTATGAGALYYELTTPWGVQTRKMMKIE